MWYSFILPDDYLPRTNYIPVYTGCGPGRIPAPDPEGAVGGEEAGAGVL